MADEISKLESEIQQLSSELDQKRAQLMKLKRETETDNRLDNPAIMRYSRQIILPEIGPKGQEKLLKSRVLLVGAGGLGCPCCIYLCAGGVGQIGLVDFDTVEISNIQRQIMHTENRVGVGKALSCALGGHAINSRTKFDIHDQALDSQNALQIIEPYDLVIDCSDNVATRYLLNDACVLAKKTLISGSALRFEGQLTVYNHAGGPCYRCLYPRPPPPETVTNCSDGGVLGAITGVIGSLQALEAIKLICNIDETLSQKLLLFDGLSATFRTVKLRPKKQDCVVCGKDPSITKLIDYEQFCGAGAHDKISNLKILDSNERVTVKEYKTILEQNEKHHLIDVRLPVENEICQLPFDSQKNIPIDQFCDWNLEKVKETVANLVDLPVYMVCHRGNDSQKVVRFMKDKLGVKDVKDIKGGLEAWSRQIDDKFPRY